MRNEGYHTFNHLIHHRGWTEELITVHLGEPDMVQTYPRKRASKPTCYFARSRVDQAEQLRDVSEVIAPRQAELSQSRAERAAQKAKAMKEAADAAEIVVEVMPVHELKIRALETFYNELARTKKKAPATMDERRLCDIAFKFATRRLVDYQRIIATLPVPLDKADVYELCRHRINAAVAAIYPQIAENERTPAR